MSSKRGVIRVALVCGIVVAVAFVIGESLGQRSMLRQLGTQLKDAQAMLLMNRVVEERELKSLLARGCAADAMIAIANTENADLKTLKGTYINSWSGCTK
jgi:hypothetical protein